ncbi:MAG: rRNA pseudouridine synthase [Desulfotomaculum sp.]|nr:rRNA pseudouridine synthase [Desulfotomaculum sp.]
MERLQKFMAHAGVASRRKCEELILEGRVRVNGKVVKELGVKIHPDKDKVYVDGRLIRRKEKKVYLVMNKPRGYVSTVKDERGRKTVLDLLDNVKERVYPVGRLDYNSEGLLILTNDGELANALTHPRHQIAKTYRVRVEGVPSMDKLERLAYGVKLEDGVTSPANVSLLDVRNGNALLEITIREGKNRQVRRMCEHIGHPVKRLVRTRIGPLELRKMNCGEVRELTGKELKELFKAAGIKRKKTG